MAKLRASDLLREDAPAPKLKASALLAEPSPEPPPSGTSPGGARYDQVAATPEVLAQSEQALIDEQTDLGVRSGLTRDAARDRAQETAQGDMVIAPGRSRLRASEAIKAGREGDNTPMDVVRRAAAPMARRVESLPTPTEEEDRWNEHFLANYAALATPSEWMSTLTKVVASPEGTPEKDAPALSRPWLNDIREGFDKIESAVEAPWDVIPAAVDATKREAVTSGIQQVWKGIAAYGDDADVRKVTDLSGIAAGAKGEGDFLPVAPKDGESDVDIKARAPTGVRGLVTRAAVKELPVELASQIAAGLGGDYGTAYRYTQFIQDARPDPEFDKIASLLSEAGDDPDAVNAASRALDKLAPADIPDRRVAGSLAANQWKGLLTQHPETRDDPAFAAVYRAIDAGKDEGAIEDALRQVPYGSLATVNPSIGPTVAAVKALAVRRERARLATGGESSEALEKVVGSLSTERKVVDGVPVFVEGRVGQVMRLGGTMAEGIYEADLNLTDLPGPYVYSAIIAGADAMGASQFARQLENLPVPTKAAVDRALASGYYDDVIEGAGLGNYRPLRRNDPGGFSAYVARVATNVEMPEFQGPGYAETYARAGGDPTSGVGAALGFFDVAADFLNPADDLALHGVTSVLGRGSRAVKGARLAPEGYRGKVALAAALPEVAASGLDRDAYTAVNQAVKAAVLHGFEHGDLPVLPDLMQDQVLNLLRQATGDDVVGPLRAAAAQRKARMIDLKQRMLDVGGTPEQIALRGTPGYAARVGEYDALVKAGTLTEEQARLGIVMDERRAFILTDEGKVASPEDYFARVSREVGGTSGAGAYFQGEPVAGAGPAFRAWFKDSKVVDEAGRPLPMYHGSSYGDIKAFDPNRVDPDGLFGPGFYFTADPEIASEYTAKRPSTVTAADREAYYTPGNIIESYGGGKDRVISYDPGASGGWTVVVQAVDDNGKAIGPARSHFTEPRPENLASIPGRPGPGVLPVHLSIQRPFDIDGVIDDTGRARILSAIDGVEGLSGARAEELRELFHNKGDQARWDARQEWESNVRELQAALKKWDEHPDEVTRLWGETTPEIVAAWKAKMPELLAEEPPIEPPPGLQTGGEIYGALTEILDAADAEQPRRVVNNILRDAGYDGITHIGGGRVGNKDHRVYIAFDPEQIKSAIGNRGTFDPNDPNILHSTIGGKQTEQGTIERVVRKPRTATLFSGGGLVEEGLRGLVDPIYAVESNADIGAHYRTVHGDHVRIADVRTVDLPSEGDVDYLHASPVCKDFSKAKTITADGEQPIDIETAQATAKAIRQARPRVFTLENVAGYQGSEAMGIIEEALRSEGYTFDARVYDAADFGAATSRKRLLLRAVKDGPLPPAPVGRAGTMFGGPRGDWYATVADIIDTLPDEPVAPWMRERLAAAGIDADHVDKPIIVMGGSAGQNVPYAFAGNPAPTIKATPAEAHKIILPDGRVKRVTPRAMARITGLPDSYPLPENRALATTIIGNGVPPVLAREVFGPLLVGDERFHSTIGGKQTEQGTIERVVREPAPTFYSALRRTVEGIKQERLTADQLRATLRNAPGVKADEIEWTGLDRFLAEHPKPTKSEVLGWLDENAVEVKVLRRESGKVREGDHSWWESNVREKEAQLEGAIEDERGLLPLTDAERARMAAIPAEMDALAEQGLLDHPPWIALDDELLELQRRASFKPGTVVPRLQRELAELKANEPPLRTKWTLDDYRAEQLELPGGGDSFEIQMILPPKVTRGETFTGGHWDEPGVVVHYRANKRRGSDGKMRVHVEEVQSDWHQEGRDAGYVTGSQKKLVRKGIGDAKQALLDRQRALIEKNERPGDGAGQFQRIDKSRFRLESGRSPDSEEWADIAKRIGELDKEARATGNAVPPAPFADAWSDLALKHLLRVVAEDPEVEGITWTTSEHQRARYPVDNEGKPRDIQNGPEYRTTYDVAIPSFLNKQGKKYGARVGKVEIPLGTEEPPGGWNWQAYPEAIAKADAAGDTELGRTLREMADWEYGDGEGATEAFGTPLTARADAALAEAVESVKAKAGPETTVVHSFDIPPKMRDALLYEGQPLFQKVGPTIHGSIEPATIGYLQRFFQTADFDTLLHEDAHLLRFLFGDDWTDALATHFDHDAAGKLTRKGEEQAAEALRWYFRTKIQPDGRLRGMFDRIYTAVQNAILPLRNEPKLLPPELAGMFDAVLRPSDILNPAAVSLAQTEAARQIGRVATFADPAQAVIANEVPRQGKLRDYAKVNADSARVRAALGITTDMTEMDPLQMYAAALADVVGEKYRETGWGDEALVAIGPNGDVVVPTSRAERVLRDVETKVKGAVGDTLPPVVNGVLDFTPAQRAGVQALVNEAIHSPHGDKLPAEVRTFDYLDPASQLTPEQWNRLNGVVVEMHAGLHASRNRMAEMYATVPLFTALARWASGPLEQLTEKRDASRALHRFLETFRVDDEAAKLMAPQVREAINETMRALGHVPEELLDNYRGLSRKERADARVAMKRLVFDNAVPVVHPTQVATIVENRDWFHANFGRRVNGERLGGAGEVATLDSLFDPATNRIATIETLLNTNPLQGAPGILPIEQQAITELRRMYATLGPNGWADVLADPVKYDTLTDALGITQRAMDRRYDRMVAAADNLVLRGAGANDLQAIVEMPIADRLGVYNDFWTGAWDSMFDRLSSIGQAVIGEAYDQQSAITAMLTGLMADRVMNRFGERLMELGIAADMDRALTMGNTAEAAYSKEIGAHGPDGFNLRRERVQAWINRIVGWKEFTIDRLVEMPQTDGSIALVVDPALSKHPAGLSEARLSDPEEVEAYTLAHRYLTQIGWQFGKGTFGDVACTLPDGREFFLPELVWNEIAATVERTAKVGIAFADAKAGGIGSLYRDMSSAVMRRMDAPASWLGLSVAEGDVGRIVPLDEREIAARRRRRLATWTGAGVGAAAGAALGGVPGAMIGAAAGRNILPMAIDVGGAMGRKVPGYLGVARIPAVAVGAATGAALGAAKTAVDGLRVAFPMTMALGRIGMTSGLVIVNPAFFVGNVFGAVFQTYMRSGAKGVLGAFRTLATEPKLVAHLMASMAGEWGARGARYLPQANPMVTRTGAIYTPEMLVEAARKYGLDSSYVKAESTNALVTELHRLTGTWTDKLLDQPVETMMGPIRSWQACIMEAATAIDNANRVGVFLDNLKGGMEPHAAAAIARDAAFDYGKLTDFERTVMRNTVLFYSYQRQSIDLFWWTLINNPSRVLGILRATRGQRYQDIEAPDVVVSEAMDNKLILAFRDAIVNGHARQGVAVVTPRVPLDFIPLWADTLGALEGDESSSEKIAARLTPWMQYGLVKFSGKAPFGGTPVNDYNEVPAWLVEAMRNSTGSLFDDLLDLQPMQRRDPSSERYPGQVRWQAGNGEMWWAMRDLIQIPPFGRSLDTLTSLDAWAPGGGPGPIQAIVDWTRDYRASGGDPATDAFFAGPARDVTKALFLSDRTPGLLATPRTFPVGTTPDLTPPRPWTGATEDEQRDAEAWALAGIKPVQVEDYERVARDRLYDEANRNVNARLGDSKAAREGRYGR